jgi:hypothetical protein
MVLMVLFLLGIAVVVERRQGKDSVPGHAAWRPRLTLPAGAMSVASGSALIATGLLSALLFPIGALLCLAPAKTASPAASPPPAGEAATEMALLDSLPHAALEGIAGTELGPEAL